MYKVIETITNGEERAFFLFFFVKIKEFDVQISKDGFHLNLM